MSTHAAKNVPQPTPDTLAWWEGCRAHQLLVQRCLGCGEHQFYPRIMCAACNADTLELVPACGRASVSSYTIVRRPVSQAYAAETPYVIALLRLTEGPTMMSNIVGCEPEQVHVGMQVQVLFEDWSETISVPKFCPVDAGT
jgi:uncharacterized protein